jgi:N-methylhydantoinase A
MAQALRVISVQRGIDPREHVLVSFGGAGGLHVCALAEALGMRRALVPVQAGVLSALGMLAAPRARQLSRTLTGLLQDFTGETLEQALQSLADAGIAAMREEGIPAGDLEAGFSLDLRYRGQSYTLNLPWQGLEETGEAFHLLHNRRYGHRLDTPVELVNIRCNLHGRPPEMHLPPVAIDATQRQAPREVAVSGHTEAVPVWPRESLTAGQSFSGPALLTETVATTWLPAGWECRVDPVGNLQLERIRD